MDNAALKELRSEMAPFGVMLEESEGAEFRYLRVVVDPADQVREHPSGKPLSGLGIGSDAVGIMARLFPRSS